MSTSNFKQKTIYQAPAYTLTCGFHTLQIRVEDYVEKNDLLEGAGVTATDSKAQQDGSFRTWIILNLNKLFEIGIPEINRLLEIDPDTPPHADYITRFSVFENAFQFVLDALGITEYKIIRADLKFDNPDPEFFQHYEKLHRFILLGFKAASGALNTFKTTEFDSPKNISASIRTKEYQLESYDKRRESNGRDPSAARFEIRSVGRSKGMNRGKGEIDGLKQEFIKTWKGRFKNALDKLSEPEKLTAPLIEWLHTKTLNNDLSATLNRVEDFIFAPEQVPIIANALEYKRKNIKNYTSVWKKRYNIKLYSLRDVNRAINEIDRAMDEFFNN